MMAALLVLIIAGLVCVVNYVRSAVFPGIPDAPSLVYQLKAGMISPEDISQIEVMKFDVRDGWPFKVKDYRKYPTQVLKDPNVIAEFVKVLGSHTSRGHKYRNHPISLYDGFLRIKCRDGSTYILSYEVGQYRGKPFAAIKSGSVGIANPNAMRQYDNVEFAGFLERYDPWYNWYDQFRQQKIKSVSWTKVRRSRYPKPRH